MLPATFDIVLSEFGGTLTSHARSGLPQRIYFPAHAWMMGLENMTK